MGPSGVMNSMDGSTIVNPIHPKASSRSWRYRSLREVEVHPRRWKKQYDMGCIHPKGPFPSSESYTTPRYIRSELPSTSNSGRWLPKKMGVEVSLEVGDREVSEEGNGPFGCIQLMEVLPLVNPIHPKASSEESYKLIDISGIVRTQS